ncbi:hypothetical protein HHS34_005295 [Acidithiobacillus montserratensis]|uniref:Uncharacterized protein n=1 Tax=Acidithiobacillus montserratensis TaxID=2729135 RepID=A0ACD5HI03_9PROT|nr:hypothetical protein [Acidithiobacillus montserratensis]MBU2746581.1 hypothetical protein [Acidithiobacillus montserratensis]
MIGPVRLMGIHARSGTQRITRLTELFELWLSVLVLALALALSCHVLILLVHLPLLSPDSLSVRPVVVELLDVLILLEISQVFLGLELRHRLNLILLLDTAATFAIREIIVTLFSHGQELGLCLITLVATITLRIACAKMGGCKNDVEI